MRRHSALAALILFPLVALAQPAGNTDKPAPSKPSQPAADARIKATTPEKHEGTDNRHENFNRISKEGKAQLVFLGDSITQGWESAGKKVWDQHYAGRQAANFGVSGDRTEHVLWRLDHGNFDGLKPKLIVIMIGTNNTGHRKDPAAETAAGVKAILDRLTVKCPDSKVLLMAIFPRGERADDEMRKINNDANSLIERFADGKRIIYKDIGSKFLDANGTLKREIMGDFLHPNSDGYKIWADAIEDDIVKMMGEDKDAPKTDKPKEQK